MPVWELWQQTDRGVEYAFDTAGRRSVTLASFDPEGEPPVLIWTVKAETYLEAMALYHAHMGWEPYQPMDGVDYEELDRQSRNALDLMCQDIRQCGGLTNFTTTSLSFTNQDGSQLRYAWDGSSYLTYTNASTNLAGCPRGGTLLKGCGFLKFSIFQRNPISATTMTFTPATNAVLTKVVVMDWICRRTNYLTLTDSESVQTAKVVMRN